MDPANPSRPTAASPTLEHLQGVVKRLTYHASDSGYTVAHLKAPRTRDLITVVGTLLISNLVKPSSSRAIGATTPNMAPSSRFSNAAKPNPRPLRASKNIWAVD